MTPEIHLFIFWEKVGSALESSLRRFGAEFQILRAFRVRWTPALFATNLSRFYGQRLPVGCEKEASCGTGPFTLVVVRDDRPCHVTRETTHGQACVNARVFDLKSHFRSAAGGHLPVHASDTAAEATHDLALLLGMGATSFVASHPGNWNGQIEYIERDVSGALGWDSLSELFGVLNETIEYVVLRNFEHLPERHLVANHGDIDLLVGDFIEACLIANAVPVYREPHRVHMSVLIGNAATPFDFRHIGDGYYDENWQRDMLATRTLAAGGFFVPDDSNHFFSLLYHALLHKPEIAPDYARRLAQMAQTLKLDVSEKSFSDGGTRARAMLLDYLGRNGYRITQPHDPTVHFNAELAYGGTGKARALLPRHAAVQAPIPDENLPIRTLTETQSDDPARASILRPFHFDAGHRILELGCEGGVITHHLGESGAHVVAVEASPILAAMAEKRCRDLPNVRILRDAPLTCDLDGPFDIVVLIGTPQRITSERGADLIGVCLERAARLLKPDGLVLLALDNPLGMKYFNGCPEETSGIPYWSINDFPAASPSTAVGRRELGQKLRQAGFNRHEFFFPFPDYRQANLILSETAFADPDLNLADLLIPHAGKGRPETYHRAFSEAQAWRAVIRNRLLPELANAFLVIAGRDSSLFPDTPWLVKMYSRGLRHPCYRVETSIERDPTGGLLVRKIRMHPNAPQLETSWLRHLVTDSEYQRGHLLVGRLHAAMAAEADIDTIAACFAPWIEFLSKHVVSTSGERTLPGEFVDCIPANLIVAQDGELHYFDAEWRSDNPVPQAWVVVRGIVYSLIGCLENATLLGMTYRQFVILVARLNGLTLTTEDLATADRWEQELVEHCHANRAAIPPLREFLDIPLFLTVRLAKPSADYQQSLAWHQAELARVKRTVSWRITAPLRVIWNFCLRLVGQNSKANPAAAK